MEESRKVTTGFFDVIADKQTYLNILYLILSFPLGIVYFIFLTSGLSLGLGLSLLFVGLPILYLVLVISKKLMVFEQKLAELFLGMTFHYERENKPAGTGFLRSFKETAFDVDVWRALVYLTLKFFMGIFIFSVAITLISLSLGLIGVPVLYQGVFFEVNGFHGLTDYLNLGISPYQESIIWMFVGVFLGISSLHIFNLMAFVSGRILHCMSPNAKHREKSRALMVVK